MFPPDVSPFKIKFKPSGVNGLSPTSKVLSIPNDKLDSIVLRESPSVAIGEPSFGQFKGNYQKN